MKKIALSIALLLALIPASGPGPVAAQGGRPYPRSVTSEPPAAGRTLRLERRTDGTVVLTAVAMVPETQLWTLEEPHRSRIERGLTWAAATEPQETDVEGLESVALDEGRVADRVAGDDLEVLDAMQHEVHAREGGGDVDQLLPVKAERAGVATAT